MGRDLKLVSGSDAVKKLQRAGWTVVRQKGSHIMLTKSGYQWTLSVPQHDELGPGLLRKILNKLKYPLKILTLCSIDSHRASMLKMQNTAWNQPIS